MFLFFSDSTHFFTKEINFRIFLTKSTSSVVLMRAELEVLCLVLAISDWKLSLGLTFLYVEHDNVFSFVNFLLWANWRMYSLSDMCLFLFGRVTPSSENPNGATCSVSQGKPSLRRIKGRIHRSKSLDSIDFCEFTVSTISFTFILYEIKRILLMRQFASCIGFACLSD